MKKTSLLPLSFALLSLSLLSGCKSAYYGGMEKLGYEKRDILVDRVESGRDAQEDAKEQMTSALEQFSVVVNFDGGNLEKQYNKLSKEYDKCTKEAKNVNERIAAIDEVAQRLFKEWKAELKQYSNASLREDSERQLKETQKMYAQLIDSMRTAADSMNPVLTTFGDQVLYLKHNLNSRAIAGIKGEAAQIQTDVTALIVEMEKSIAEADAFIATMKGA
ncbi:DUF2959 domain-containing protein [Kiritimatiellota bacterium B12222]|nr:DUF2959 domain-containing protein [Kiritimatiellota bacterium B12222]